MTAETGEDASRREMIDRYWERWMGFGTTMMKRGRLLFELGAAPFMIPLLYTIHTRSVITHRNITTDLADPSGHPCLSVHPRPSAYPSISHPKTPNHHTHIHIHAQSTNGNKSVAQAVLTRHSRAKTQMARNDAMMAILLIGLYWDFGGRRLQMTARAWC